MTFQHPNQPTSDAVETCIARLEPRIFLLNNGVGVVVKNIIQQYRNDGWISPGQWRLLIRCSYVGDGVSLRQGRIGRNLAYSYNALRG